MGWGGAGLAASLPQGHCAGGRHPEGSWSPARVRLCPSPGCPRPDQPRPPPRARGYLARSHLFQGSAGVGTRDTSVLCPAGSPAPSLGREAPKLLNDKSRVWGDQRGERPRVELAAGRGGAVCEVAGKFWPRELGGGVSCSPCSLGSTQRWPSPSTVPRNEPVEAARAAGGAAHRCGLSGAGLRRGRRSPGRARHPQFTAGPTAGIWLGTLSLTCLFCAQPCPGPRLSVAGGWARAFRLTRASQASPERMGGRAWTQGLGFLRQPSTVEEPESPSGGDRKPPG